MAEGPKQNDDHIVTNVKIKRRNSEKGNRRREEILTAAMRHFSTDGYQSASFAAIAESVGLTLPGLLHYFPTKVDLLLAILEKRDVETVAFLRHADSDWRKFLLELVEMIKFNTSIPGVVRLFALLNAESLTNNHPGQDWFLRRAEFVKGRVSKALQLGIAAGEICETVRADAIATELIAIMDGLQMLWLRSPDDFDMVSVFSAYIDRLICLLERKQ
jgi:AcrR family transcriptional regulator